MKGMEQLKAALAAAGITIEELAASESGGKDTDVPEVTETNEGGMKMVSIDMGGEQSNDAKLSTAAHAILPKIAQQLGMSPGEYLNSLAIFFLAETMSLAKAGQEIETLKISRQIINGMFDKVIDGGEAAKLFKKG